MYKRQDLNVTSTGGSTTVAPGQENAVLTFELTNDGNDTQAYFLDVVNVIAGDDFDPTVGTPEITYVPVGGGAPVTFVPGDESTFPRLDPDDTIVITVQQDIPAGLVDTDQGQITLVADTRDETDGDVVVSADTDGNNDLLAAENVLADDFGTPSAENGNNDVNEDGAHSAAGLYVVAETKVSGVKTVSVFSEDGTTGCTTIPGTAPTGVQYAIPGACVEYLITVTNSDEDRAATGIVIGDTLPDNITFRAAAVQASGDFTGTPVLSAPADGTDCASGACVISLSGVTLPAAPTGGTTEGVLVIRATVN